MLRNISASNTNWQQTTNGAASGSRSAFVSETAAPSSTVDLYSPTYNFNAMPNVALTFKWAGAERDSTTHSSYDAFSVYFSTNCGASWVPRITKYIKLGTNGISGLQNGNFYPTPAQFHQEVITIGTLASATNVLFRIRFMSETGSSNNFYIDDINLSSITSLKEEYNSFLNLNIFPSPASDNISVAFDLLEDKKVEIALHDVLGRTIKTIAPQSLGNGDHVINIPVSELSKGIYFVKVSVDNVIRTEKIIVE